MAQKLSLAVGLEQHELTIAPQPDGSFTMQVDEEEHRVVLEQVGKEPCTASPWTAKPPRSI